MARIVHGPPFAAVVFDCDSTLSSIEGIEELTAEHPEISALTAEAMAGRVPLEEVYGRRLELAGPLAADMERIARRYEATAIAGAAELIAALHHLGKRVEIVSGGLLPAVRPFGVQLGVPAAGIHAVDVEFDTSGAYVDYDRGSPLARAGGKRELLAERFPAGDVVLVGDGATDLEAKDACARFIAFTAVERRPDVVEGADVEVSQADHAALLPHLVSAEEVEVLRAAPGGRFEGLLARLEGEQP
ncbi:HAD-IB family phosphatase [Planctomycetota bacterium]|nr:HAD-IB family phosphatase [Planctomycetota bacterium]